MRGARLVASIVCMLATLSARAEEPELEEIQVVSALRRMETPLTELSGTVSVVGRDEIERRGWRTLADALHEIPGLQTVQSGGLGKQTSFFIRGTNSNHTLVLLDGIEISDPSLGNLFDGAHLLTQDVERIEVVRGPQGTLYGSDAIGGVINIVSRTGRGRPGGTLWAEAGAHNTFQHALSLRGEARGASLSLSYSTLHSRGFTAFAEELGGHERDGYDNRTLSSRLGFDLGERATFDLVARLIDSDSEIDRFLDDPRSRSATRQLLLGGELTFAVVPNFWSQRLLFSFVDHDRKDRAEPSSVSATDGITASDGGRAKWTWLHDLTLAEGQTLSVGVETESETLDTRTSNLAPGSSFESRAHDRARTSAAFLQHQFSLRGSVFGTAGIRVDRHDEFDSQLTYRLSTAYVHPATATRIRASIGTGFKSPTLTDLFGQSIFTCCGGFQSIFRGNPELDPERSRGFEVGLDQPFWGGKAEVGTTYFQNRIRDLITTTPDFSTLDNVSEAITDGFESYLVLTPSPALSFRIDHTYTRAEDRDTGEELLRRPSHRLSARLETRPIESATVSVGARYVGHRKDIDALTFARKSLPGYTIADLAATYEFRPGWRLFGRAENVFDRDYGDPDGFQSRPFGGYLGLLATF